MSISIKLEPKQRQFLNQVFHEAFDGGSTAVIQGVLGDQLEPATALKATIEHQVGTSQADTKSAAVALDKEQWRVVYDSINAVMYGLGPFELQTCTGVPLQDALNVNLRICAQVWGAYGKMRWE